MAQSFLQSDTVEFFDRQIVSLPGYIRIPSAAETRMGNGKPRALVEKDVHILSWCDWKKVDQKTNIRAAFLTNKPLYGGRDAPLRWFIAASRILRSAGRRQLRSDCCIFCRYSKDDAGDV